MSSTYFFLGNIDLEGVAQSSPSAIAPLLAGTRKAVGTDFVIEPYAERAADDDGYHGPIRFAFVDQARSTDDLHELSRGVSAEIADALEAILGWRPPVDIQALWWGS